MAKRVKMKKAEFIKDHVFFLKGVKRSICAKQFKKIKRTIEIPLNYWEDFALKGIVKATDKQIEDLKKKAQ